MLSCTEIKPGSCFTWENELYQCIDIQLNKTAMAKMKVKVKVKVPRTGVVKELSFIGSDQVGEAHIDKRPMQYLYDSGDAAVFMDSETYEQLEIPKDRLEWEMSFLVPNLDVNISFYEGEILGVILPDKVELELVECEQAVKGNTATSALKNAVTETGLQIKVPLFIEQGEHVIVSTIDGKYSGRA
ncbi:MAG: elongation factor P [Erysipelotrichaceae bacterium]|nr:elongation factor P [Erysipelotrichaceae bacterium]